MGDRVPLRGSMCESSGMGFSLQMMSFFTMCRLSLRHRSVPPSAVRHGSSEALARAWVGCHRSFEENCSKSMLKVPVRPGRATAT